MSSPQRSGAAAAARHTVDLLPAYTSISVSAYQGGLDPPPPRERLRTVGASVVPLQFSCKVNLSSAVQVVPAAVWPTCAFELVSFAACATVEAQRQKCSYCFRGYCGAEKRKAVRVEPRI